ncbi:hypothetical protein EBU99_04365 [bacterium]|nr:hypothetical protein [bacterium]
MTHKELVRAPFTWLSVFSLALLSALVPGQVRAQALVGTENFQELFTTAGYSALFGAALGTAVLPFLPENSVSNLRVVAGGASLGFVLGSAMALYNLRQQSYGMRYAPDMDPTAAEPNAWRWDVGTSNGKDLFVKMDSRF